MNYYYVELMITNNIYLVLIFTGTYDRYIPVMIIPFKHCTGFRLKHLIYNCKMHTLLQVQRLGKRFGSQLPGNLLGPTARPMSLDFSMFEDGKNFVCFSFLNIPQNIFCVNPRLINQRHNMMFPTSLFFFRGNISGLF